MEKHLARLKKSANKYIDKRPYLKKKRAFLLRYRRVFGVIFIVVGIAGLFLPVLQGSVMILLGAYLLLGDRKE